jgi:hypothetical protein
MSTTNTEKLPSISKLSLLWVGANVFSIFGGVLLGKLLYGFLYPSFYSHEYSPGLHIFSLVDDSIRRMVIIGLSIGVLAGALQRPVFKSFKIQSNFWIPANILGWGLGFAVTETLEMFVWQWGIPQLLGGMVIGLSQWLALRRHLPNAYWWIIATVTGSFAILSWIPVGYTFLMMLEEYSIPIIIAGLIMGIFTGTTLSWLQEN